MRRMSVMVVLLVGTLVFSGCSTGQDQSASTVARRFYSALADKDGPGACDVLAPKSKAELEKSAGKPCDEAILDEDVPHTQVSGPVSVYGTAAQVRLADDTAFLARFQGGWKVTAAGCKPQGAGAPYDCEISGG